ncbi:MAG: hypothetical protein K1X83_11885 [Oligoflexia bacterium]|nr:hypothetical protein [Oligoflexia bacterium]
MAKEPKTKVKTDTKETAEAPTISSRTELKTFLTMVREKLFAGSAPPIYAVSALQFVFNHPNVYELLDKSNKEIAKEIWVKLKQSGVQVKNPPLLFTGDEAGQE